MNRKIKFRIWSKKYKLFTNNPRWPSNQYTHEEFLLSPSGEVWRLVTPGSDKEHYFRDLNCGEFVVQRATGLTDKRNNQIYEGDIVCIPNNFDEEDMSNNLVEVKWFGTGWAYKDLDRNKVESIYDLIGFETKEDTGEIVGNIFENSELCKTAK